jgi:hypothetical protein
MIGLKRYFCTIGSGETVEHVSGCCLVLCNLFALLPLTFVSYCRFWPLHRLGIFSMDLSDVERLDAVVAEGDGERWHGCILCPGEGDAEPFNLLVQGPVVRFYKLTTGNVHSRQATDGIIIPTTLTLRPWTNGRVF